MVVLEQSAAATAFGTACELFELGCEIMERNLRRRHAELGSEAIQKLLVEWLLERPGAERGDSPGRLLHPLGAE